MSSKHRCDYCLKQSKDPINLICEHILCFSCGSALLKVEIENELQNKYRITCPKCKKITYTYDLNNLLLSSSCSVTRGFSSENDEIKRKKACHSRRSDRSQQKSRDLRKNKLKQPESNQCRTHKQPLNFYCENQSLTLCDKCRPTHNPSHKVIDLECALPTIVKKNTQFRMQSKEQVVQIETRISNYLKMREEQEQAWKRLSNQISNQFRIIELLVQKRKEQLLNQLDFFFKPQIEEMDSIIADTSELRNKLKMCGKAIPESNQREVYILRSFETIKECIARLEEEITGLGKHSVTLQKAGSIDNLRTSINSFLCLNLWTKKNAGKLLTPSEYFSQLKQLSRHKLSHSSTNFQDLEGASTPETVKRQHQKVKNVKLREYGI